MIRNKKCMIRMWHQKKKKILFSLHFLLISVPFLSISCLMRNMFHSLSFFFCTCPISPIINISCQNYFRDGRLKHVSTDFLPKLNISIAPYDINMFHISWTFFVGQFSRQLRICSPININCMILFCQASAIFRVWVAVNISSFSSEYFPPLSPLFHFTLQKPLFLFLLWLYLS